MVMTFFFIVTVTYKTGQVNGCPAPLSLSESLRSALLYNTTFPAQCLLLVLWIVFPGNRLPLI